MIGTAPDTGNDTGSTAATAKRGQGAIDPLERARLESLRMLGLPLTGRRVLCVGADEGVVEYFLSQGCSVQCSDVDGNRINRLREAFPGIETRVISLQGVDLDLSGIFDIGYCGGLHNNYQPAKVLRSIAGVCGYCVVIDGYVLDSAEQEERVVDDEFGHRYCPSLSKVIDSFRDAGYPSFYVPRPRPGHEHYQFEYLGDGAAARNGRPLRQMVVASRAKLEGSHLVELERGDAIVRFDPMERWPLWVLKRLVRHNYRPAPIAARPGWYLGATETPPPDRVIADRLWRVMRLKLENQGEVVVPWYNKINLSLSLDDEIAKAVFVEGMFEPTGFWILDRLLEAGMTFVDIGANFGLFTLFASPRVGPTGCVLAFEPSRRELDKMTNNVASNHMSNVRMFADALGAAPGTARLLVARMPYAGHNTLGSFAYDATGLEREETVKVRTLDEVIATEKLNKVHVIKMDVEGAELSVLQGALSTLRHHRPSILMELSDRTLQGQGSGSEEILAFLHASAYEVFEPTKDGFVRCQPGRIYDGSNVLAIPAEYVARTLAKLV